MIIDKNIKIKITKSNIIHYSSFFDIEVGDIIEIETETHLQKGSNKRINVECDICKVKRFITYQSYIRNITSSKKYPIYTCDKCSHIKIKETNLEKYGIEHLSKDPNRKDSIREKNLEKWGVDHYSKTEEFLEKSSKTKLERYGDANYNNKEKFKKTMESKYGVDHYSKTHHFKEKFKKTMESKYGVDNPMLLDIFKNKLKDTNLKKYGVDFASKLEITKQKNISTNLKKYGFTSYTKTKEFTKKVKKTNLEKWGVDNYLKSEPYHKKNTIIGNDTDYINYIGNSVSSFKCKLGHSFDIKTDNYHSRYKNGITLCTICNPISNSVSIKESDVYKLIKSIYDNEIIISYRDSLEIDIYLPELKIGFEFNGLYWHSEIFKDKKYHLNKTNYFKERGIRIIHIWEDDWIFKRNILESQIQNLLGLNNCKIFARKCFVKELKSASQFLNNNHLQGTDKSIIKLGLFCDNNKLISVMTFNKLEGRNKMSELEWNLSRFCNKLEYNVIGGASKLLKYFIKKYKPTRIISYADKDWSIGDLYYKLGFILKSETKPDYKYIINNKRKNKQSFKKSNLGIKGEKITESEYMKNLKCYKIWDCGKLKFEKNI